MFARRYKIAQFGNMTKNSNPASNATWYPNSTNHLFSFSESGWFFLLVEAPAMSEQPKKPHISAGLLAHVRAKR